MKSEWCHILITWCGGERADYHPRHYLLVLLLPLGLFGLLLPFFKHTGNILMHVQKIQCICDSRSTTL